jgi:hypothetical protein
VQSEHEPEREDKPDAPPQAEVAGRSLRLPRSRALRTGLGLALLVGGALGALPVLGFWMIPLGLAVLAYDWPPAARLRDAVARWFKRAP